MISRFTSIGDMTDGSTTYRVSIWLGTLDMLKHYWLCGIGPGMLENMSLSTQEADW